MEPITLCGLSIVLFGLWVEFEPGIMAVVNGIRRSRFFTSLTTQSPVQHAAYVSRMPLDAARSSHW